MHDIKIMKVASKLNEVQSFLMNTLSDRDSSIIEEYTRRIEEHNASEKVKVAFIGQYSAGKSTMISALTGNKAIKIDADIATDETADYIWNSIVLTDTPGLYTDRTEHDEITKRKIDESDLLIYCLTSDLFDDVILENFKNIAYEKRYKHKMMLVVNKMSMESGDYDELTRNYNTTLSSNLKPFHLNAFPVSYIDAADYIEGIEDDDEELVELSHFDSLVHNLNTFVDQKGLLSRYDTPVRISMSTIDDALSVINGHKNKELIQTLKRLESKVLKRKNILRIEVRQQVKELGLNILDCSRRLEEYSSEENASIDEVSKRVEYDIDQTINTYQTRLESYLQEQVLELQKDVEDVIDSEVGQYVIDSICSGDIKLEDDKIRSFSNILSNLQKADGASKTISTTIQSLTNSTSTGLTSSLKVAGSQGHKIVYNVGKFFGKSFRPWEAVKIAKNITNVAKVLGPIISVFTTIFEFVDTVKEESNVKKKAEADKKTFDQFLSISNDIEEQFFQNFEGYMNESVNIVLDDISKLKNDLLTEEIKEVEISQKLMGYRDDLNDLLVILHEN